MKRENLRLEGKEVYLRYPDGGDYKEMAALYRLSRKHLRGQVQPKYDRQSFDQLLAEAAVDSTEFFFIVRSADEKIVGTIALSQIFRKRFQNAYLGYLLGSGFTGNGFMTEAVRLVLKFAFLDLKLHRVEANVQPDNEPSKAVLRRNGFINEGYSRKYLKIGGRWRDHERWAIIREDWRSRK
jgi:ribosomal-protein-alanine N-acetyltransferase